ncbi:MAG: FecR domain-containing protein, partial [Planctomycetota bacterium]
MDDEGPNVKEARRLATRSCDQALTATEHEQLDRLLESSPAAQHAYLGVMDIHAAIAWRVTGGEQYASLFAEPTPSDVDDARRPRPIRRYSQPLLWVATAASLAIALWAGGRFSRIATADVVGSLVRPSDDCRWFVGDSRGVGSGGLVRAGDEVCVISGTLQLNFTSGAEITLQAPTVLTAIDPMKAYIDRGSATTNVENGLEGFTVETPSAAVVDFGTLFGVNVDDKALTRVAVFNGEVEVTPAIYHPNDVLAHGDGP